MEVDEELASDMAWDNLSEADQASVPGGILTWQEMTSEGQDYLAAAFDFAVPGQTSALDVAIDQGQERQRIALARRMGSLAAAKHLPYTYDMILALLDTPKTAGGNTGFAVSPNPSDPLRQLIANLGLTSGGEGGCEWSCRSGGLTNSPHFDHNMIHMDNFNAHFAFPIGIAMHFFVDVLIGSQFYGRMPFSR